MLTINNLHAQVEEKNILKGFNLTVNPGEVHAIMGPNGSGKSTLASVLAGNENFEVTQGTVELDGKDLLEMAPEERAREGVFLAFQYPIEIPGVSNTNFLRAALTEVRKHRGLPELDAKSFLAYMKEKKEMVELTADLAGRAVNEAFLAERRSATRSFRWRCSTQSWPSSMRRIRASTLTRCASWPTG
jgi:Fe-S cluster assembly ATP-binding protein